ncbi:hypothetical protein SAMN05444007_1012 [Cribrihabitans marinus]|uniref:DUF3887 domain-containing protein n=1 Tax=Cribrihabitans marinus TaxID=1227549 RepID=A0A1H6QAE8_9RHOB|nr:hypothetical protein [Cribrihabitans marinus]GGH17962.1 hypothetical protein GCM10010973_00450 [Cribrihabitans marinus]SEI38826.1 hypothetical protein SAMN05444007_1012 [Cribrihabitans marinus]
MQGIKRAAIAVALVTSFWIGGAAAQVRDSVFTDYDSYSSYVDRSIMSRQFGPFIQAMGGRDEYTSEQLAGVERQFTQIYPVDFEEGGTFNRRELGSGIMQEGRYFRTGDRYVYYYALLHQRDDSLIVLEFALNSDAEVIMNKF